MAMGVDVSRVYLTNVRLRNATEAGCQAYANALDVHAYIFEDKMIFTDKKGVVSRVFTDAIGKSGSFVPVETRKTGTGVDRGDGKKWRQSSSSVLEQRLWTLLCRSLAITL